MFKIDQSEIQEDELDSCGAVPDYVHPPRIDLPECSSEFSDILEIYKDLFAQYQKLQRCESSEFEQITLDQSKFHQD